MTAHPSRFRPRLLWALALSAALTGCATMQSHDKLATDMQTAGRSGGIPAALASLESTAKTEEEKTALLFNMERGELLRMDRRYPDSTNAFLLADNKVKEWEETAKTNPSKLMGTVGAALVSERLKVYEGQDYEKVWLTTRLALKNGYSNALSHYLAGFLYEMLNEPGLAAPGYRKAIELKPETAVLEEGLRGLDNRTGFTWKRRQRMTDVLFIVEAGDAPARKPKAFTIPVPTGRGLVTASISYPVIEPSKDALLTTISAAGTDLKLEKVVDVNVMARRALKDEMPGMVLRGFTRAVAKGVLQNELQKRGGLIGGIIGAAASVATEQADDRMWRMLPGRVYVARGYLPPGEHTVSINGRQLRQPIKIDGQYALVPLRMYDNSVLIGDVAMLGQLPTVAAAPQPAPAAAAAPAAPVRTTNNNRARTVPSSTVKPTAAQPAAAAKN